MNKIGVVLGVAAVATLAGCKDPNYKYANADKSQGEVKQAEAVNGDFQPAKTNAVAETKTAVVIVATPEPEVKPLPPTDAKSLPPSVDETTPYIVQRGDTLSKISARYNITIAAIKKANPKIKNDVVMLGQTIQLPGKVNVGEQKVPVIAKPTASKTAKPVVAYTGATKEYVVKGGDTLGAIAYGNGINIRQLKAMNGLSSDVLKVGQKLKVPAEKVAPKVAPKPVQNVSSPTKEVTAPATGYPPVEVKTESAATTNAVKDVEVAIKAVNADDGATAGATAEKQPATATYVVKEGDDVTGVAVVWGVSAAAIRELNGLGEQDQLTPGQVIKLPADAQQ